MNNGQGLNYNAYTGNNDFRGFLANQAPQFLSFTGNDGGVNQDALRQSVYGTGNILGGLATDIRAQESNYNKDANSQYVHNVPGIISSLYQNWSAAHPSGQNSDANVASTNMLNTLFSQLTGSNHQQATSDPNTAQYYADQASNLQNQVGRLDNQQNIGLGNIGNSYNTQYNRLQDAQGQAQNQYNTNLQQNMQGYANTQTGYMNQARANMNALQRLLGMNGSGNSSAAYDMAPYAVASNASQGMNDAQQTYATNMNSLDNNWQNTQKQYQNSFADLNQQKYAQENQLKQSIAQTRANLLDQIGQANANRQLALGQSYAQAQAARNPYTDQVNALLGQITQLGNQYQNPVLQAAAPTYQAPDLTKYYLNPGHAPTTSNQPGAPADLNPGFLGLIAQKDRNQFGQPVTQ